MLNFENLDKFMFAGCGKYDVPIISPEQFQSTKIDFIPFNFARTEKLPDTKGIHFFIDDYQFARLWNWPNDYILLLQKFCCVCAPDFSTYTDMPMAMQIYNHYRKHWLAAYWQAHGIKVIPTISWSTPESFEWCFDGEPTHSIVAISSVGTQNSNESKQAFLIGFHEMVRRLQPAEIIFYGPVPEECDWNVRRIRPYYKTIEEKRKSKCLK